jgi:hypothetical protein
MVLIVRAFGLDPSEAWRVFGSRQATLTSLSVACRRARADLAWALLLHPPAPPPAAGRTAHQAAQLHTRAVAMAGHRPPHEDLSRPPPWSPHTTGSAPGHPLPAAPLGRLSASRSSPVMGEICPSLPPRPHFGHWLPGSRRGRKARQWQLAAGLISGQVKKNSRRRKLVRVTHVMRLGTGDALTVAGPRTGPVWTTEHRFHRAGPSDGSSCSGSLGASHLGQGPAIPPSPGPGGMVASFLSWCATPHGAASGACAAARTRWQAWGATRPPAH